MNLKCISLLLLLPALMLLLVGCGKGSDDAQPAPPSMVQEALMDTPTLTWAPTAAHTQVPPTPTPTPTPTLTPTPTPTLSVTEASTNPQWQSIGPTIDGELTQLNALVASQQDDGAVVYVGGVNPPKIFKWSEATQDWTDIGPQLPAFGWVDALAVDPIDPQIIYAGLGGGEIGGQIAKSTDSGNSWTLYPAGTSPQQSGGVSFAISNEDTKVIYSGTRSGLLKSVDGGETWQLLDNGIATQDFIVWTVAIDPQDNSIVFAGGEDQAVIVDPLEPHRPRLFHSKDAGESWTELTYRVLDETGGQVASYLPAPKKADCPDYNPANPPPQPLPRGCYGNLIWHFIDMAFDPMNSQTIYIGLEGYGLVRSQDGGQLWTKPAAPFFAKTGGKVWGLTFDPVNPTRLLVSVWASGTTFANVFEGRDEGELWEQIGEFLLPSIIGDLAISEDGTLLYASVGWDPGPDYQPGGLWRLELVP